MKVPEILRLIGRDGWYLDRQKGSHRQYKHPSKQGLVTVAGSPIRASVQDWSAQPQAAGPASSTASSSRS